MDNLELLLTALTRQLDDFRSEMRADIGQLQLQNADISTRVRALEIARDRGYLLRVIGTVMTSAGIGTGFAYLLWLVTRGG